MRSPPTWRAAAGDETGAVGGFEALPFGLLVFVVGLLLLVNAWGVVDAKLAAVAAAREAARAFVESSGPGVAEARAQAELAAAAAIEGHKDEPGRWSVRPDGPLELRRCTTAAFVVDYDVPVFRVPWIGSLGDGVITTRARHAELVDPYRRGLAVNGAARPCGA